MQRRSSAATQQRSNTALSLAATSYAMLVLLLGTYSILRTYYMYLLMLILTLTLMLLGSATTNIEIIN
jgi:Ca2+/Na+ antiporter